MSLFTTILTPKYPVAPGSKNHSFIKNTKMPSVHCLKNKRKETPLYASLLKASYTIEAAVILPIFLTVIMFGVFCFRMLEVQVGVQNSIETASRSVAIVYMEDDKKTLAEAVAYARLLIETNKVPTTYVKGKALGFDFSDSEVKGNYINLKVSYKLRFPIGILGNYNFEINQEAKTRKWIGYDPKESAAWTGEYVYMSNYSEVYHGDMYCSYLNPSISFIAFAGIKSARNKSGHRFNKCKYCDGDKNDGTVIVTDYGTSYHSSINCSKLKRNVRTVLLKEVEELYPPCSKCIGDKDAN